MSDPIAHHWCSRLRDALPELIRQTPELEVIAASASRMLHGSTTRSVDDAVSDLDVWFLPPKDQPSKFVEFKLDGKAGHVQIESRTGFESRLRRCDFQLIFELRYAIVLADPDGWADRLIARARQPMPAAVREAWFAHHYIEMRSEHRALDNPIERRDAAAILQALTSTVSHALRAAMVLDGVPYPYVKWLAYAAAQTPTGQRVTPLVERIIDGLAAGMLRVGGPEREHPLNLMLRQIRNVLIDAAREAGINAPWLQYWYLHLNERDRIHHVTWETT